MKSSTKKQNILPVNTGVDNTINELAKNFVSDIFLKIKTAIGEALQNNLIYDTIQTISVKDKKRPKITRSLNLSFAQNKDGSFSTEKEEDMNINVPGISINSKPRSDGRYQGYIVDNGVKKYVYGRDTNEVVAKIKHIMQTGLPKPKAKKDKSPTLKEWAEKWLELYKVPNLKPKSVVSIKYSLKKLYAGFENVRIAAIKTMDLQEFFLSIKETRARDMALNVLNEMLEKARKQGLIKTNPCEGVEIKKHVQQKKKGLTPDQQETLEEAVKGTTLEPIFTLLLTGGFRIGELLALTSDDVDFERNTVTINKDVVFINGQRVVQTTKTEAGIRTIPLPQTSIDLLKGRKGLLFNTTYNAVRNSFRRLVEKTGIDVSAHMLRHTYSNRLEEAGVPPKVKQYLLGHANLDITQNTYTDTQSHYVSRFLDKITTAFDTKS